MNNTSGNNPGNNSVNTFKYHPECDGWKTVTVIRIADGENKGNDRINIVMSCPMCGGDIPISGIVPHISSRVIYFNFSSRVHCKQCGKFIKLKLPRKPTKRWKELAEQEIRECLWEDAHKYIPEIHSQSGSKKKRMPKRDIEEQRQKRYGRILKALSDAKRKVA